MFLAVTDQLREDLRFTGPKAARASPSVRPRPGYRETRRAGATRTNKVVAWLESNANNAATAVTYKKRRNNVDFRLCADAPRTEDGRA